jgi:arylsulfatase A-like enzyme
VGELRRLGLYDRTVVVITADHGELFGEHGLANHFKALSEEETHVPLIVRYPARIPAKTRVVTPVELSDVVPTLVDLLGVAAPGPMDGATLLPLLTPGAPPARTGGETFTFLIRKPDPLYPHTAPGHLIAIRTDTFKYVWSSTGMHAYYDLGTDPHADRNRYGTEPEVVAASRRLDDWRQRVGLVQLDNDEDMDRLTKERLRSLG